MTHTTFPRWLALGLPAIILVTGSHLALADPNRPTDSGSSPAYPVSDRQTTPVGSPCLSCDAIATHAAPAGTAPLYRPPRRLAPLHGLRVGGGTRTLTGTVPTIAALVPDYRGLTSWSRPTLYWYSAGPVTAPVEFVLTLEHTGHTIAEFRLPPPITQGVHEIHLGDYGLELEEGNAYVWSVALVMDSNRRSKDILAVGSIERAAQHDFQAAGLAAVESVARYADAGFWYDALATVSAAIAKHPGDRALQDLRGALLRDVGLMGIRTAIDETTMPTADSSF